MEVVDKNSQWSNYKCSPHSERQAWCTLHRLWETMLGGAAREEQPLAPSLDYSWFDKTLKVEMIVKNATCAYLTSLYQWVHGGCYHVRLHQWSASHLNSKVFINATKLRRCREQIAQSGLPATSIRKSGSKTQVAPRLGAIGVWRGTWRYPSKNIKIQWHKS